MGLGKDGKDRELEEEEKRRINEGGGLGRGGLGGGGLGRGELGRGGMGRGG